MGDGVVLVVVMMLWLVMMMVMVVLLVVMLMLMMSGVHPYSVPLSTSLFLLLLVAAQPSAILLVPCAQRFPAKHEIVVFDHGRYHPCVVGSIKFYLVDRWVWDMKVRNKHVILANPARR